MPECWVCLGTVERSRKAADDVDVAREEEEEEVETEEEGVPGLSYRFEVDGSCNWGAGPDEEEEGELEGVWLSVERPLPGAE